MDKLKKQQCAEQLRYIAELLSAESADGPDIMILETCASLIGVVVSSSPAAALSDTQFNEYMFNYQLIYSNLNHFMTDAARKIPLDDAQKALMQIQTLYDEQKKKHETCLEEQRNLLANLEKCRSETEALYKTNGPLFREYEEVSLKLSELRKLEQEYNPARLPEMTAQADALTSEIECLRERYEVLNTQTAECLHDLGEILQKMKDPVSERSEKIEQVRSDAEDLARSIETCCEVYKKYKDWFETTQTPLQHLENLLGKTETEHLRGVMDEETLRQKNELVRRIHSDLEHLDQIVSACAKAAQSDYESTYRRAGK